MAKTNAQIRLNLTIISILPWLTVLFAVVLPFTFSDGLAPLWYLGSAFVAGGIWLYILLNSWKRIHIFWYVLPIILYVIIKIIFEKVFHFEVQMGHFFQWLFILMGVVSGAVYFNKQQIIEYCGLKEMMVPRWDDNHFLENESAEKQDDVLQNVADELLRKYQTYSYHELKSLIGKGNHAELLDLKNLEGEDSQIVMDVFWDDRPYGDIQVTCEIVSGSYKPLLGFLPVYVGRSYDGFVKQQNESMTGD